MYCCLEIGINDMCEDCPYRDQQGRKAMSEIKQNLKKWIDANIWDGEDRSGCEDDWTKFTPDGLQELIDEIYEDEIEPKIKDLERQLAEARGETTNLKLIIKDIIKSCREHELNNTADEIERQLKEKGDD